MDSIGPVPKTYGGNIHILNVVDNLSIILRFIPLPSNYDAIIVAKCFMEHTYRNHCVLGKSISDYDSVFISKFWKRLFGILDVKISLSTALPSLNGRTNRNS